MPRKPTAVPSRRSFLQASAAATAAGGALLSAVPVHAKDSATLKIGLVGCGGRGAAAARNALLADKGLLGKEDDISWNFEKFLIGRNGEVVARFAPDLTPEDPIILEAIETELAKD